MCELCFDGPSRFRVFCIQTEHEGNRLLSRRRRRDRQGSRRVRQRAHHEIWPEVLLQFWDAVADAKHPRHEEALSGVKASRARLMNEAESRRKETTPSTFTTKKVKTLPDEVVASNLEAESASPLKVDYGLPARTALQNVKQELATKEVKQWVRSELESTDLRENFNILGKTTEKEDKEEPRKQGLKLNAISGRTFGMTKEGRR